MCECADVCGIEGAEGARGERGAPGAAGPAGERGARGKRGKRVTRTPRPRTQTSRMLPTLSIVSFNHQVLPQIQTFFYILNIRRQYRLP